MEYHRTTTADGQKDGTPVSHLDTGQRSTLAAHPARQDEHWPTFVFGEDTTIPAALFVSECVGRRHRAFESKAWSCDLRPTEELRAAVTGVLYEAQSYGEERLVVEFVGCVVHCRIHRWTSTQRVELLVSGPEVASVRVALDACARIFPAKPPAPVAGVARLWFWTEGRHGPIGVQRILTVPTWADTAHNYPASTRQGLAPVMADLDTTAMGGRLMLWHGRPGTGKTSAIRALAREHAGVARVDVILEPEAFLGRGAGLLTAVLDGDDDAGSEKWRILVFEDADELIAVDAKERAGQSLSRLLNLADGLFGQGFKVLALVTTNEPMTAFHPAATRAGRCGSLVDFASFGPAEAAEWLATAPTAAPPLTGRVTLAELYAIKAQRLPRPAVRSVGFRPRQVDPGTGVNHGGDHVVTPVPATRRPGRLPADSTL